MVYKISIIIEKDDAGYYVYAPELPGCQTQGETLEEAKANMKEALDLYLETMDEDEVRTALSHEIVTESIEVTYA